MVASFNYTFEMLSQSYSQIVEEAFFSGHRLPLPRRAGLVAPPSYAT
jgi:hypothetical protein